MNLLTKLKCLIGEHWTEIWQTAVVLIIFLVLVVLVPAWVGESERINFPELFDEEIKNSCISKRTEIDGEHYASSIADSCD